MNKATFPLGALFKAQLFKKYVIKVAPMIVKQALDINKVESSGMTKEENFGIFRIVIKIPLIKNIQVVTHKLSNPNKNFFPKLKYKAKQNAPKNTNKSPVNVSAPKDTCDKSLIKITPAKARQKPISLLIVIDCFVLSFQVKKYLHIVSFVALPHYLY